MLGAKAGDGSRHSKGKGLEDVDVPEGSPIPRRSQVLGSTLLLYP